MKFVCELEFDFDKLVEFVKENYDGDIVPLFWIEQYFEYVLEINDLSHIYHIFKNNFNEIEQQVYKKLNLK